MTVRRLADDLIVERAEKDLDDGIAHKRKLIRESGHPILAAAIQAGINAALVTLQLRARYRDDVRFVISLAHRCAAGEDPLKLADENVERALRVKELALIVREKDPSFPEMVKKHRDVLALRLPDLARMVTIPEPKDYSDIVARAFPDRKYVERMVEENRIFSHDVVDHLSAHPHLIRVPQSWVPKLDKVARELIEWQTAKILRALDDIYA